RLVAGHGRDALGLEADMRDQEVVAVVAVVEGSELGGGGKRRGDWPADAGDPTSVRCPGVLGAAGVFSAAAVARTRAGRPRRAPRTSPTSPRDAGAGTGRPARSRSRRPR